MVDVVHVSPLGAQLTVVSIRDAGDITAIVGGTHLESLASGADRLTFWFSPSPRPMNRRVNRRASELLFAYTTLDVKTVPLLHGNVVVTARDVTGNVAGLSWQQLDRFSGLAVAGRAGRLLSRRCDSADHLQQRWAKAAKAREEDALDRWLWGPPAGG